ncbi:MAG: NAD-dependent epimerase/dehydratase family protein [Actinobacteria bacterium]|nr:NAD-dependent epimerase/dehydratase family protein [Actinomycetota bacterium]
MKILVTGGAGFIGSHLVDGLTADRHSVVAVDDLSGGHWRNIRSDGISIRADCRDTKEMDKIFKKHKPQVVYHLAANAAENKAQFSPIDITSRNYDAFIKVLTPFIKYGGKRFIFTSSIAVYGKLQTPFMEHDKPEPEDLYGITKLAAEQTLQVMSSVHGFEYVITRPHNVYGPRQNMSDPYRNVVTRRCG